MFTMGAKLEEEPLEFQGDKGAKKAQKQKVSSGAAQPKSEHQLVFRFERRNGKPVSIVGRFLLAENDKKEILKHLKKKLACGGKVDGEWIELQGDVKEKIKTVLEADGWKFRK